MNSWLLNAFSEIGKNLKYKFLQISKRYLDEKSPDPDQKTLALAGVKNIGQNFVLVLRLQERCIIHSEAELT